MGFCACFFYYKRRPPLISYLPYSLWDVVQDRPVKTVTTAFPTMYVPLRITRGHDLDGADTLESTVQSVSGLGKQEGSMLLFATSRMDSQYITSTPAGLDTLTTIHKKAYRFRVSSYTTGPSFWVEQASVSLQFGMPIPARKHTRCFIIMVRSITILYAYAFP